jgi:hypothetical protein
MVIKKINLGREKIIPSLGLILMLGFVAILVGGIKKMTAYVKVALEPVPASQTSASFDMVSAEKINYKGLIKK